MNRNHLTDHDPVIASLVHRVHQTAERRNGSVEPRTTFRSRERERRWRRVLPRAGEEGRQWLLLLAEDVDGELDDLMNELPRLRALAQTEEHERRVERQGRERVGCQ